MEEIDVNVEAADEVGNTDTAVDEAEDQPEPVVKFTSAAPLLKLLQEKDLGGSGYILWFYTTLLFFLLPCRWEFVTNFHEQGRDQERDYAVKFLFWLRDIGTPDEHVQGILRHAESLSNPTYTNEWAKKKDPGRVRAPEDIPAVYS